MADQINNHLRWYRKQKLMTQAHLAVQVGVSRQTIISIEKSKYIPSVKLALLLALTLETAVDNLFYLSVHGEPSSTLKKE